MRDKSFLLVCSLGCWLLSASGTQNAVAADEEETAAAAPITAVSKAKPPFRIARKPSRLFQKYTGITFLSNTLVSAAASTALSVKTGGLVKANIKSYSLTDMLDGKFKSVDVKVDGGKVEGVPLGKIHVATTNPFRLRYFKNKKKGRKPGLKTPVMVALEADVAEKDLSTALKSKKVATGLRFLKLDLPGLGEQRLQILDPKVELQDGKVKVNSWLVTAGAPRETGIPLEVIGTPALQGERLVVIKNLKVNSDEIHEPDQFATFAADLLNPLVDLGRMDRYTHAVRFTKLQIGEDRVKVAGKLLLAPKAGKTPGYSAGFQMNVMEVQKMQAEKAKSAASQQNSAAPSPAVQ